MNWFKNLFTHQITAQEVDERIRKAVEVAWLKSMQRLDVRDGDIIVIRYPGLMSFEKKEIMREYINEFLDYAGIEAKIIFLAEGIKIGVLRKGE